MAEHYFFKTMSEKGRNRLRPLSGQSLDGVALDQTFNVSSVKDLRTLYPLGTIFGSVGITQRAGFYEVGDVWPLSIPDGELKDRKHMAPPDMKNAYSRFIGATTDFSDITPGEEREVTSKPPRKTLLDKMKANEDFKAPSIKGDGFHVDTDNWYLLLRNIKNQVNTLLIGPTGSGKTELVILACKKLGVPCSVYDMGSMYDPVSGLLGVHRLQKGGESIFDYAKFTEDISKPGVVLLDELSRAPVTTNNILFPCLDSRRKLPVEIAGGEDAREIFVHPDCCFIATANVGSEYTGTMSMDKALVNRFFPIELSYLPENIEQQILMNRCSVDSGTAKLITKVSASIRNLYNLQEIASSISTRETIMACELISDGWSTQRAMELIFLPLFEGTKVEGERSIVNKLLMSR